MTPPRTRVKVCGITSAADAALAIRHGADAIGLVFWARSPRAVTAAEAAAIVSTLPPFVTRVGVFVNASAADVAAAVQDVGLDAVQLHGDEDPAAYGAVGARLLRSVTLDDERDVARVRRLPPEVVPLVDAADAERRGGTGRRANWMLAAVVAAERPLILAGGLTDANVAEAVRLVRPWAVDVSSGVEEAPGRKSPDRMAAFFERVYPNMEGV